MQYVWAVGDVDGGVAEERLFVNEDIAKHQALSEFNADRYNDQGPDDPPYEFVRFNEIEWKVGRDSVETQLEGEYLYLTHPAEVDEYYYVRRIPVRETLEETAE